MTSTSRHLLLLRHAKSSWDSHVNDFERPLSPKGITQAEHIGTWMLNNTITPQRVISSPANRAVSTAQIVCDKLKLAPLLQTNAQIYDADTEDLLAVLTSCPAELQSQLIVGHNPGLELLVLGLAKQFETLYPASLVHLTFNGDWAELPSGIVEITNITHGKLLTH